MSIQVWEGNGVSPAADAMRVNLLCDGFRTERSYNNEPAPIGDRFVFVFEFVRDGIRFQEAFADLRRQPVIITVFNRGWPGIVLPPMFLRRMSRAYLTVTVDIDVIDG